MITAVDTNILLDIFYMDEAYWENSAICLKQAMDDGIIVASSVVWMEAGAAFKDKTRFALKMHKLDIKYESIDRESAWLASKMWQAYRKSGGKRDRIAADFLIGAHASTQADCLLTRDHGFYRKYFDVCSNRGKNIKTRCSKPDFELRDENIMSHVPCSQSLYPNCFFLGF